MTTEQTLAVSVQLPAAETLQRHGSNALAMVEQFQVVDAATYELAAEELQAIQKREKTLTEQRLAITRPMDEAKASVMALYRGPVELLGQAAGLLKGKMLDYQREQQRKANEERQAAEAAARLERERLEREAAELEAQGRAGEAAVKQQVAAMVVAPPPAVESAPKVAGISTRTSVDFEVQDLAALVQHVAQHPELVNLLAVDSVKLRAYVKGLGLACKLPGVRVFEKATLAASRK